METYAIKKQVSNAPDEVIQVGDGSFSATLAEYRKMARAAWRSPRNFMQVEFRQVQKMSWWRGRVHHYLEIVRVQDDGTEN